MKKLYSLVLAFVFGTSAFAQVDETFVFTDAKGNVIPNGSTITVNNYEIDPFEDIMLFPSGVYVKNNSDSNANAGMTVSVTQIDNGKLQHCFPGTCQSFEDVTISKVINGQGGIKAGESASIQSEWMPEEKGTCIVTYTVLLTVMTKPMPPTYAEKAEGATITVKYVYDDNSQEITAGVEEISDEKSGKCLYNLAGQKVGKDYKGIVVVNGRKVLNK